MEPPGNELGEPRGLDIGPYLQAAGHDEQYVLTRVGETEMSCRLSVDQEGFSMERPRDPYISWRKREKPPKLSTGQKGSGEASQPGLAGETRESAMLFAGQRT